MKSLQPEAFEVENFKQRGSISNSGGEPALKAMSFRGIKQRTSRPSGSNSGNEEQSAGTLLEVCNFEVWAQEHNKAFENKQ